LPAHIPGGIGSVIVDCGSADKLFGGLLGGGRVDKVLFGVVFLIRVSDLWGEDVCVTVIGVYELPEWFTKQVEELLFNYRSDIRRQMDRIEGALAKTAKTSDQLLEEVVIDGELTVPGAASKLSSRLKSIAEEMEIPDEITYTSVQELLDDLEDYLREATNTGRRYIPRLPKVHKKIVKELDYQFRVVGQGYQKIRKLWEKEKLPKQLDQIGEEVEEIEQRSRQLLSLVEQLSELEMLEEEKVGRIEEQQGNIEQFRMDSGLKEIEGIRKEIDSIRMIVTNQLNFLKKPFKKLSQAAGRVVMMSSTAGEGADAYSADPWHAFQKDTDSLEKLKAGLTALAEAVQGGKLKFKDRVKRKVLDSEGEICGKGGLNEYRHRFSYLESRKADLKAAVSIDERRKLEKSLERAKWEHRDVKTELAHTQEQIERISTRLKALQKRLQKSLSKVTRDDITIEFPDDVEAFFVKGATSKS
jgi:archaellum component FlaC